MSETALEALAIFAGGLLGSGHCVGMCGGFVLALGLAGRSWKLNLGRQLLYGLGRVFTYTFGGMLAGFAGSRMSEHLEGVVQAQAWLCLFAGALLLHQGLKATGFFGWFQSPQPDRGCVAPGMFADLLRASRLRSVFLGGMINGLLPCGLVYAFLALAGARQSPLGGGAVMLLFGLGTLPVLALMGVGAGRLGPSSRQRLLFVAAWCVMATGVFSIYRGYAFLQVPATPTESCPLCATDEG